MKKMRDKVFVAAAVLSCLATPAFADYTINVPTDKPTYIFDVMEQGEGGIFDEKGNASPFNTTRVEDNAIYEAAKNWYDVIQTPLQNKPATIITKRYDAEGADCLSDSVVVYDKDGNKEQYLKTAVNAVLHGQNYDPSKSMQWIYNQGFKQPYEAIMNIGVATGKKNYNATFNMDTSALALYQSYNDYFLNVVQHEMAHGLGISSTAMRDSYNDGFHFSDPKYLSTGEIDIENSEAISNWDKYLRVYDESLKTVVVPERGMYVLMDKNKSVSDFGINQDHVFDIVHNSPYFVGPKTMQVLAGLTDDDVKGKSESEIIDYAGTIIDDADGLVNYSSMYSDEDRPRVNGMPIHPTDDYTKTPDLSHLELRNSYMSHQYYRNWTTFMEAELATLVDIGYDIDLKDYFGQSFYLDNITDTVDTVNLKNNEFDKDYAVGVHVYSDNNKIIHDNKSNITSTGNGSFGVRVEGVNNTYTIQPETAAKTVLIDVKGDNSIGLGVTYGNNHTINIENGSTVQTTGKNSPAISFDFGKNVMSEYTAAHGSYINNFYSVDYNPLSAVQGALVGNFNLAGTISAGQNSPAIYISENAHVNNINIENGASITGNIVSEWNSVKGGLFARVQYKASDEKWYLIAPDDIDNKHYTDININSSAFNYAGNILGNSTYTIDGNTYTGNTLKLNIADGKKLNITDNVDYFLYSLNNDGEINIKEGKSLFLSTLGNTVSELEHNGIINVEKDAGLTLSSNVETIENNTVNLKDNALLSTINEKVSDHAIEKLTIADTGNKSKLSFDLGDRFDITNEVSNTAEIKNIYVNQDYAESLSEGQPYTLFTNNPINLGTSSVNFYYGGNRYTLSQQSTNRKYLTALNTSESGKIYDLSDAAGDKNTINYIVSNGEKQSKNAGTLQAEIFEISGADLDFNGHEGLTVGGEKNIKGTTIRTSVYGAETDLTVKSSAGSNGKLVIDSSDKEISLGFDNETALDIGANSSVTLNSEKQNSISVFGKINGTDKTSQVNTTGYNVNIYNIDPVTVNANAAYTYLNGISDDVNWNLNKGTLYVTKDSNLSQTGNNAITFNGGALNLQNNQASQINLAEMTLNTTAPVYIDVDFNTMQADRFAFNDSDDLITNNNILNVANVQILNQNTQYSKESYVIPFINSSLNNTNLLDHVDMDSSITKEILTPILKYNFGYQENKDTKEGNFILSKTNYGGIDDYNPAVLASSVAQQGMYMTQINTYDQAFANMDMTMLIPKAQREAMKTRNKYSAENGLVTYDPNQFPGENRGVWFRPFTSFESVGLNQGPKTDNISYGGLVGGDSDLIKLSHGWDMIWGAYAGYNGSQQKYMGNSIYQNGGTLGLNATWYKGNFFTGLTANIGASGAEANTMYGREDFAMLATGIASKTGYNWELFNSKLIIQPSYLMSYSFINTFDYRNASGASITSDPLNAIQIVPGLKFIGNLPHGWQPYASVQMVWNLMDKTKMYANTISLPEMSVDPYVQYGVGLQKAWGDRFTGFGQVMMRNGGRNGVSLQAGFRYELGQKGAKSDKKSEVKHYTQRNVSLTALPVN